MLPLPAPVQSGETEDSPSLSDDGRLLAFSSDRILGQRRRHLRGRPERAAEHRDRLARSHARPAHRGSQTHPYDVGQRLADRLRDGTSHPRERDVQLYSRSENRLINAPVLSAGLDTYDPAPAPNGSSAAAGQADQGPRRHRDLPLQPRQRLAGEARRAAARTWATSIPRSPSRSSSSIAHRPRSSCAARPSAARKLRCTIRSNERATGACRPEAADGTAKKTVQPQAGPQQALHAARQGHRPRQAEGRRQRPEQEHHPQARPRRRSSRV